MWVYPLTYSLSALTTVIFPLAPEPACSNCIFLRYIVNQSGFYMVNIASGKELTREDLTCLLIASGKELTSDKFICWNGDTYIVLWTTKNITLKITKRRIQPRENYVTRKFLLWPLHFCRFRAYGNKLREDLNTSLRL